LALPRSVTKVGSRLLVFS